MIDAAREKAEPRTRLLFELLLGTGQRIGDVLKMKWSDFDGEAISVRQGKTKANLWIPAPQMLLQALGSVNGGVKFGHCGGAKVGQFGASALERAPSYSKPGPRRIGRQANSVRFIC